MKMAAKVQGETNFRIFYLKKKTQNILVWHFLFYSPHSGISEPDEIDQPIRQGVLCIENFDEVKNGKRQIVD